LRFALLIFSLLLLNGCQRRPPLDSFTAVPPFTLTAQDGRQMTRTAPRRRR
jgi:hypothetical protein